MGQCYSGRSSIFQTASATDLPKVALTTFMWTFAWYRTITSCSANLQPPESKEDNASHLIDLFITESVGFQLVRKRTVTPRPYKFRVLYLDVGGFKVVARQVIAHN